MDNLEGTDKFLEMYSLPGLNQEKIENKHEYTSSSKDTESVVGAGGGQGAWLEWGTNKIQDWLLHRGIPSNVPSTVTTTTSQIIAKMEEEGMLLDSFYEARITLIAKPGEKKNHTHNKFKVNITDEHRC